jgi:hypothetical protein
MLGCRFNKGAHFGMNSQLEWLGPYSLDNPLKKEDIIDPSFVQNIRLEYEKPKHF